ncbi:hypothetical protein [Thermoanaerobacterium thermosaccharolyticum]|uniref:hypothetical protein n=1 Tax=Thermoanaerobacterium thermosaccharolyticum TaxID=1517 RepID=UPI003DA88963
MKFFRIVETKVPGKETNITAFVPDSGQMFLQEIEIYDGKRPYLYRRKYPSIDEYLRLHKDKEAREISWKEVTLFLLGIREFIHASGHHGTHEVYGLSADLRADRKIYISLFDETIFSDENFFKEVREKIPSFFKEGKTCKYESTYEYRNNGYPHYFPITVYKKLYTVNLKDICLSGEDVELNI